MNIYKARWRNALKQHAKLNRLYKKGYMVFDSTGEQMNGPFILENNKIVQKSESPGHTFTWRWFENNKETDHGLYMTIKEYNQQFAGYKAVHPKHIQTL